MLRYLTAENRTGNISVADVQKDLAMSREEIEADLRLLNLVNHGGGTYLITASMGDESIEVTPEPAGQALAEPVRLFPMMARAVSLALDLLEGQVALEGKTPVSYTHLRAHETVLDLVCRLLLEKKKNKKTK